MSMVNYNCRPGDVISVLGVNMRVSSTHLNGVTLVPTNANPGDKVQPYRYEELCNFNATFVAQCNPVKTHSSFSLW